MTLPYDYARCNGRIATLDSTGVIVTMGQAQCVHCLRRTSPGRQEGQEFMEPPQFVTGRCSMRIGEGEK